MIPRKLTILDKSKLTAHLQNLQGEERRLRFGGSVNDEYIAEYVEKSFKEDSKWFGVDHIDGYLVAACHVALIETDAELGCSVDKDFRNQGLAQLMFDRAVTWLRSKGINHVFMHCLSENGAMKHIARKNQMTVVSCCGDTEAEVDLEPANAFTPLVDAYADRVAVYDMVFKNNIRLMRSFLKVSDHT